jgi:DNA-binding response OmpR family regulator
MGNKIGSMVRQSLNILVVEVDRTIDVHIRHLRSKIGSASKLIRNVHGVGYKVEE